MLSKVPIFSFKNYLTQKTGFVFFKVGILLLPSLPSISGLLLLIASIIGALNRSENFFKDKYNYPFIAMGFLMIISCLKIEFSSIENVNSNLQWVSTINWLPFFWCFWSFKNYLSSQKLRIICANYFVLGSVPLLISGIIQYFFKWYGPFEFLNGLIVWFLRPICSNGGEDICVTGLTGFFNNPNVSGAYLALLLPFSISFFKHSFIKKSKTTIFYLTIFVLICVSIFLTTSRNAWLGIIISFFILFNKAWLISLFLFFLIISFPFLLNNLNFFPENISSFFNNLIPYNLRSKFFNFGFSNLTNYPRFLFFITSIEMIFSKPLFGWGASMYTIIYGIKTNLYSAHSHNLFFELAINYGILVPLIFLIYICWLTARSIKLIKENQDNLNTIIDKAFYSSLIVISIIHLFDIPYFDARISVSFWVLISSLRGMILENENKIKKIKNYH